ncbi:tetraspanin-8-like [Anabas testudineus]|uniref:Tetraspanin n=1 Tax=Anabas testudineus TaxID=64144 RepID=A0A7N6A8D1_ANATE|nr:tetraspanin-8-like [Anabas testudineus]
MAVNKCIKYLLFFFNLLFWLSGCLILAVGIYLKVSKDANKLTSGYLPGADLMIAIGVIIMVLGFFGCCGAIRENRCLLLLFFISLLLIFILLLAAGILGAIGEKKVDDWVKEQMNKLSPLSSQPTDVQAEVEQLQQQLKCCGLLNGPSDWNPVPSSCRCNGTASNCGTNGYYSTPCANQVISVLKSNMLVVLGIAFAIAVLLIFGMVFSMILYCQIGRKEGAISPGRA